MPDNSIRAKRKVPLSGGIPGVTMTTPQTVVSMIHIVAGGLGLSGMLLRLFLAGTAIPLTLRSALVIVVGLGYPAGLLVSGNWMREGRARGATLAIAVHVISGVWILFIGSWPIEAALLLISVLWISPMLRETD